MSPVEATDLFEGWGGWLFGPSAQPGPTGAAGSHRPSPFLGLIERLLDGFSGDPVGPGSQLASLGTVGQLKVPDQARSALVSVSGASVYMTTDGSVPSSTNGVVITAGQLFTITGKATLQGASFLQVSAGGVVNAQFYT